MGQRKDITVKIKASTLKDDKQDFRDQLYLLIGKESTENTFSR